MDSHHLPTYFADDISLLSSRQRVKRRYRLTETAQKFGLKVNTRKTNLMKMNHKSNDPVINGMAKCYYHHHLSTEVKGERTR